MKLSKVALMAIRGSSPEVKKRIGDAIDVSVATVYRYLADNDDSLTKAAALEVIREETGLSDEQLLDRNVPVTSGGTN